MAGAATINLAAGENVTIRYTNTKQGSITVIKDAVPDDPQDFGYTATGAGAEPFRLDDDADPTLSNTQSFTGLGAGTYTITETAVSGWTLTTLVIGGAASASISGGAATVDLAAGEAVTVVHQYLTPAFTGTKYYDANESTGRDLGEPGLAGWTIELYADVDNDGQFEPNGPFGVTGDDGNPVATAVTDANGNYSSGFAEPAFRTVFHPRSDEVRLEADQFAELLHRDVHPGNRLSDAAGFRQRVLRGHAVCAGRTAGGDVAAGRNPDPRALSGHVHASTRVGVCARIVRRL